MENLRFPTLIFYFLLTNLFICVIFKMFKGTKYTERKKEVIIMAETTKMSVTENKGFDPNSDTAMFAMVNRHADKMKAIKVQEEYERMMHEQKVREMEKICAKHQKFERVCNFMKNTVLVLSTVFLVWVFASWVNVIMHNTQPGGYEFIWSWNFFKVFFGQ